MNQPQDSSKNLYFAAFLLLYFGFISLFYHYVLLGSYLGQQWPAASLGEMPEILGNDITRMLALSAHFDPYASVRDFIPFEAVPYPPLAFVFYGLMAKLGQWPALVVFYAVFVGGLLLMLWKQIGPQPPFIRAVCCLAFFVGPLPVFYELDRANLDGWVLLIAWIGVAIAARQSARGAGDWLSPAFIGVAAALKLYPLAYILIYLKDRQYARLIAACAVALVTSLASALVLKGGIAGQISGFLIETKRSGVCFAQLGACNNLSLIYPFQFVLNAIGLFSPNSAFVPAAYGVFCLAIGLASAALVHFRKPRMAITVTIATILMLWLPAMSFQYKLLFLFIPVFVLLNDDGWANKGIVLALVFALIPKKFVGDMPHVYLINHICMAIAFGLSAFSAIRPERIELFDHTPGFAMPLATFVTIFLSAIFISKSAKALYVPAFIAEKSELAMSKADAASHYGFGWGPYEGDATNSWRWTLGCVAQINLRLPAEADFRLTLTAMTHKRNPEQFVTLLFNGNPIGSHALAPGEARQLAFDIPQAMITRTKVAPDRIRIHTSQCDRPEDSNPARLGIVVARIAVERLPAR